MFRRVLRHLLPNCLRVRAAIASHANGLSPSSARTGLLSAFTMMAALLSKW